MAEQSVFLAIPPGLPLYPSPTERTVSSWARNYYYMKARHCTSRRRKLGQGSGTIKTAANLLPWPLLGDHPSIPLTTACGYNPTACGLFVTEALFQLCSRTISWLLMVIRLCCGLAADSTGSWPFLLSRRCSGTWLTGPDLHSHRARLRAR